jgi:hypothetical protein
MHSLDALFYVRIKLNDLRCEIPPAPLFERGETSLARHFLQLPPFAKGDGGGFSCVGATNIQVMSVYEAIKFDAFVKSPTGRHSREGGSPEDLIKTGFPPPRE